MSASYPQVGSVLASRYRLLRIVGEGGMGVVFEALHTGTGKRVALKWLHPKISDDPEARARLLREARATGRVSHRNVVEIYDVVEDGDAVFLVMELLEGETLEAALSGGQLPLHRSIAFLLAAMHGVAEAHRQGVIHRDINPANIFLAQRSGDRDVVAKVLDFGISKLADDDSPNLTRAGTTLGTPHYMSLEQLCNPGEVDERTDVYSFGAVLYRLATGRPPFEGATFTEVAIKVGSSTPIAPRLLQSNLPEALEQLILWAMAREREQRIADMSCFIRELEPFSRAHSFLVSIPEPLHIAPFEACTEAAQAGAAPTAAKSDTLFPMPTRRPLVAALLLLVLVLVGAGGYRLRSAASLARSRADAQTPARSGRAPRALPQAAGPTPILATSSEADEADADRFVEGAEMPEYRGASAAAVRPIETPGRGPALRPQPPGRAPAVVSTATGPTSIASPSAPSATTPAHGGSTRHRAGEIRRVDM
ncbi:MAG: serine/threonine protein kinase [Myxococcaceae bacterium]|nr:serine/threonine protein kinase [Myxococcaceae bacterium]